MIEGPLMLAILLQAVDVSVPEGADPVPVAQLTVRSEDGIRLKIGQRDVTSLPQKQRNGATPATGN